LSSAQQHATNRSIKRGREAAKKKKNRGSRVGKKERHNSKGLCGHKQDGRGRAIRERTRKSKRLKKSPREDPVSWKGRSLIKETKKKKRSILFQGRLIRKGRVRTVQTTPIYATEEELGCGKNSEIQVASISIRAHNPHQKQRRRGRVCGTRGGRPHFPNCTKKRVRKLLSGAIGGIEEKTRIRNMKGRGEVKSDAFSSGGWGGSRKRKGARRGRGTLGVNSVDWRSGRTWEKHREGKIKRCNSVR